MEKLKIDELSSKLKNQIIYFEEMNSTQDYAKNKTNIENGGVVITDNQIKGKGTHGRKWYTNMCENITMTITYFPQCDISKMEDFTVKIAEIIKNVVFELYGYKLELKQPNDLLLNNKKICGILTECSTEAGVVKKVYIGIGFNVNQKNFNKDIEQIATSLLKEFNIKFKREKIIISIIEKMNKLISSL